MEKDLGIAHVSSTAARFPSVIAVWLFGSRAKGNAQESSDYDILVDSAFEELRKRVLVEGVKIYDKGRTEISKL